ncbi:MAG: hypothetical protein QW484_01640 [Candidatus Pacearchaeota archaeon]
MEKNKKPPRWVWKAYNRWERKVRHGMGAQGEAPIIGWYVKKRRN